MPRVRTARPSRKVSVSNPIAATAKQRESVGGRTVPLSEIPRQPAAARSFTPTPEAVIAAVQARGSDPRNLRDAAHEACHAIGLNLDCWDRESVHAAIMRLRPSDRFASEVTARAVEQVVCANFGVAIDGIGRWALITCMESVKNGVELPSVELVTRAITNALDSAIVKRRAAEIVAMGERRDAGGAR